MDDKTTILVRILARTDAVFWPCRSWQGYIQQTLAEHRQRYLSGGGVPWHSAAKTTRSENITRLLAEMEKTGSIRCTREKSKVRFIRLSEGAERLARQLVGMNSLASGILTLQEISRRKADGYPRAGWTPETRLAGCNYGAAKIKAELRTVQFLALPALTRGWLEFGSTARGAGFYRVTAEGKKHLGDDAQVEPDLYDPEAGEIYSLEFNEFARWLQGQSPEKSNELYIIPLSAG